MSQISWILPISLAALIAWRLFLRIRRLFVRQPFSARGAWTLIAVFSTLIVVMLALSLFRVTHLLTLIGGTCLGAALGRYGLRVTKFEQTATGLFFTPNSSLGAALSVLVVARLAYKALQISQLGASAGWSSGMVRSPFSLLLFGALGGYYVCYGIGLLRWRRHLGDAQAER